MELTQPQLSYLASLIREDLAGGVMAWYTPEGASMTRIEIRDLAETLEPSKKKSLHQIPLAQLALPIRIHNALYRSGYKTVGALLGLSKSSLMLIYQIGEDSADQIIGAIEHLKEELQ